MSESHGQAVEQINGTLDAIDLAERRRALLIINPYATAVTDRLRALVLAGLASRYDVDAVDTNARGHATEVAKGAVEAGYDLVIAYGGDGTVNEVANGLIGSSTPLSCLPGGSANVYCKLLGIPNDIVDATEHLLALADEWTPRLVDVGSVDGRHYTFSAGLGIDASVVARVDANPRLKRRFGANFFLGTALWTFARRYLHNPVRLVVSVDGETIDGITAIVQNAEHYTYLHTRPIDLARDTTLESGTLAGIVLRRGSVLDAPALLLRAMARSRHVSGHEQIGAFANATVVTVRSADERPLPLQIDGDYIGDVMEARFTVLASALTVLA